MRKLYKPIMAVIVFALLFTLSACSVNKNKLYDIQHQIQPYTKVKCVTEKEKYSVEDKVIRFTITNISDEDACINPDDDCFELQKLVDGEWKWVGEKVDHYWTELAYYLPPNESETREINLEEYFYLPLEKGKYRIESSGIISNTFEVS